MLFTAGEEPGGLKGYFGMTVVVKETTPGPGLESGAGTRTGLKQGAGLEQGSAQASVRTVRILNAVDWGHILTLWSHLTHVHLVPPRLPLSLDTLTKTPMAFGARSTVRVASVTRAYSMWDPCVRLLYIYPYVFTPISTLSQHNPVTITISLLSQ